MVVGTYAPHFSYVAPPDLYKYYHEHVTMPENVTGCQYPATMFSNRMRDTSPGIACGARAAYYANIEFEDGLVGQVYDAFQAYLRREHRTGIFLYLSGHGDLAGEHGGLYGKKAMFENSSHIPMLFAGSRKIK